jgi:4-hydroxy-2-oxoheptanedioate aldolase
MRNHFRDLLNSDRLGYGVVIKIEDPAVIEMAALSGFDFAFFDLEHTAIGLETLQSHLRAALAHGMGTVVRPPGLDPALILRILDIGAEALLVPGIAGVGEARLVVDAGRFPPLGQRGVSGSTRANEYGAHGLGSARAAADELNARQALGVMIENTKAAAEISEIAAIDGLDFVFIGPDDLSASMGKMGTHNDPEVRAEIDRIIEECRSKGKAWTTFASHPAVSLNTTELIKRGASLAVLGVDMGVMVAGFRSLLARANEHEI